MATGRGPGGRGPGGDLAEVVADLLGARVIARAAVTGGDVNTAVRFRLDDGRTVFVKSNPAAPPGLFRAEADGLAWLGETGTVRVPRVLARRDEPELAHRFLVLEWIEPGAAAADHDEVLGRSLAALHAFACPRFGWAHDDGTPRDNWIGPLPQPNAPCATWAELYGERRLAPLVREGVDRGLFPASAGADLDRLLARLDERCGPPEPPSRLHGDLWGGNAITDAAGRPVLVDPAVYGGHREVDLAMMRLFGGFGPRVFAAYHEASPLAEGHEERVGLYQLYPLLVHAHLFGGGYVTRALDVLRHLR